MCVSVRVKSGVGAGERGRWVVLRRNTSVERAEVTSQTRMGVTN